MKKNDTIRAAGKLAAATAAIGAVGYVAIATRAWRRFGQAPHAGTPDEQGSLLDAFMPHHDVVERHHIAVDAPASVTLESARSLDLAGACVTRALFKAREVILRAHAMPQPTGGLVSAMRQIGWGVLADGPGQEVVLGAVTRPWEPNPVFRSVPSAEFAAFSEPGFVKIAFTLRADPVGERASIFRTETRAVATDAEARRLFRRYWTLVSPGVALIRLAMLKPVKIAAERRAGAAV